MQLPQVTELVRNRRLAHPQHCFQSMDAYFMFQKQRNQTQPRWVAQCLENFRKALCGHKIYRLRVESGDLCRVIIPADGLRKAVEGQCVNRQYMNIYSCILRYKSNVVKQSKPIANHLLFRPAFQEDGKIEYAQRKKRDKQPACPFSVELKY